MSNHIVLHGDQEMIWKVGVCHRQQKKKKIVFFTPIIILK